MHWCWGILEIKGGEGGRLIYLIKTIVCLCSRSECNTQSSIWTCTLLSLLWIVLILHGVIPTLWPAQVLPLLIEVWAVHIPWCSAHLLLHSPVMLWPLHCVLFSGLPFLCDSGCVMTRFTLLWLITCLWLVLKTNLLIEIGVGKQSKPSQWSVDVSPILHLHAV